MDKIDQLLGIYDASLLDTMAQALGELGVRRAWVVHGGGLDEVAPSGPTDVAEVDAGIVRRLQVRPADAGLPEHDASELRGGDPAENAAAVRAVLAGEPGAKRDAVLLNTACALVVAGTAPDLRDGAHRAAEAVDSGGAKAKLEALIEASRG